MKKDLFSLRKVGLGVAAVALAASTVYAGVRILRKAAGTAETDDLWVMPKDALTNDKYDGHSIAFIGVIDSDIKALRSEASQAPETDKLTPGDTKSISSFTLHQDADDNTVLSFTNSAGDYLKANGQSKLTVEKNDYLNEVKWNCVAGSNGSYQIKSVNGGNIYFDSEGSFKLSTNEGPVTAYVQMPVYRPSFAIKNEVAEATDDQVVNTIEGTTTYLRYAWKAAHYTMPEIVISAKANEDMECAGHYVVEYQINGTDADKWINTNQTADTLDMKTLADKYADTDFTIYTHTAVLNEAGKVIDYTQPVSQTYNIVKLNDPVFDKGKTYGTWNDELTEVIAHNAVHCANYALNSNDTLTTSNYTFAWKQTIGETTAENKEENVNNVDKQIKAEVTAEKDITVDLTDIVLSKSGFSTYPMTKSFTVKPFYYKADAEKSNDEGFFHINSDPEVLTRVEANQVVTFSAEKLKSISNDTIFNVSSAQASDLKFVVKNSVTGKVISEAADYTVDGQKYLVTVPATVKNDESIVITVPAGAFYGKDSSTADNMKVFNTAWDFNYNSQYDGVTFIAQKTTTTDANPDDLTTVYIDNTAEATAQFKIYAGAVSSDATVSSLKVVDGKITKEGVTVTRTDGKSIEGDPVVTSDGDGKFTLSFQKEGTFYNPGPGTYLIQFPATTLIDNSDPTRTNKYNTSAYLDIKEHVNFTYSLVTLKTNGEKTDTVDLVNPVCELNPIYLKVVTETASGQHPQFTVAETSGKIIAGTYNSGALFEVCDGSADQTKKIGVEWNGGEDCKYSVPAGVIRGLNNLNAEGVTNVINLYTHLTFAGQENVAAVDQNSDYVEFTLTAKGRRGYDWWKEAVKKQEIDTITINGNKTKLEVADDGKAKLYIPEGTKAGTYNIVFGKGAFTHEGDTCKSNEFTQTIKLDSVTFAFANPKDIISTDKSFELGEVTAKLGETAVTTTQQPGEFDVMNGTDKVGTLKDDGTVDLTAPLAAGVYTLSVAEKAFKAESSFNKGSETFTLNVHSAVKYSIKDSTYVTVDTLNTAVEFVLQVTPAVDAIDGTTVINPTFDADKALKKLAEEGMSLNDGGTKVFPKSIEIENEANAEGNYVVKVTFDGKLDPNNYVLNIPVDGVGATNANNNDEDLFVKFQVYKVVNFSLAKTEYAVDTKTEAIYVQVKATDDENIDRTDEIVPAKNIAEDYYVTYLVYDDQNNFKALGTTTPLTNSTFAIPVDRLKLYGTGTYTIKFPEQFTVDASINDTLVATVDLKDAPEWVTPTTLTVNEKDDSVAFPVSQIMTTEGLEMAVNPAEVRGEVMLSWYNKETKAHTWDYWCDDIVFRNDSVIVKFDPERDASKHFHQADSVELVFQNEAIKAGNTLNPELHVVLKVIKTFEFNDNFSGATTTTFADLLPFIGSTVDSLTYNRTFKKAAYQAFCVPFSVCAGDVKGASLIRLNDVAEQEGVLTFYYTTLEEGDSAYANMPYVILPEAAGNLTIGLKNIKVVEPQEKSVESSTTKETFIFTGTNYTKKPSKANEYYALTTSGLIRAIPTTSSIAPWRWVMTTTAKDIKYAKIVVDGIEITDDAEATAIKSVTTGEDYSNANVYSVGGQRLSTPRKGAVNIINGKKVVVK